MIGSFSAIRRGPGKGTIPLHVDDAHVPEPFPEWAVTGIGVWAFEDWTEASGPHSNRCIMSSLEPKEVDPPDAAPQPVAHRGDARRGRHWFDKMGGIGRGQVGPAHASELHQFTTRQTERILAGDPVPAR